MACFLVPAAEAIIVSAAVKISEKNEKAKYSLPKGAVKHTEIEEDSHKLPFPKSFLGSEICFGAARFCLRSSICGTVKFRRFPIFNGGVKSAGYGRDAA